MFHADLDEIELDLSAFPNLVEFFVRALKHNARPIAANTNMVIILLQADNYILFKSDIKNNIDDWKLLIDFTCRW